MHGSLLHGSRDRSRRRGDRHGRSLRREFERGRNPADVLAAGRGDVTLAASTATDRLGGVRDQVRRRSAGARFDGGDEADAAGVRLADEDDEPDPGLLAHGDRELAEIACGEAVDAGHDDTVVRDRGEFRGAAERQLGAQRLDLVLERLGLVELALDPAEEIVGLRRRSRAASAINGSSRWSRATVASPVIASMRRRFEPIDDSLTILMVPMSPVARTCVPPQSSIDDPASSTRTMSPYLSPKNAIAPSASASSLVVSKIRVGVFVSVSALARRSISAICVVGDRFVVAEVEPQAIRADHRAGLLDVLAEHLSQRVVQQVRARCGCGGSPPRRSDVDRRGRGLARGQRPRRDPGPVAAQVRQGERGVDHLGDPRLGGDGAGVADLTAGLGVERCPVEEDVDQFRVGQWRIDGDHRQHTALGHVAGVADELGDPELLDDVPVRVEVGALGGTLLRRLRPVALRSHLGREPLEVDRDVALAGDLLGQLQRESVGVVQEERGGTGQRGGVGLQFAVEDARGRS